MILAGNSNSTEKKITLTFNRKSSLLHCKIMTRFTCLFLPQMQLSQITLKRVTEAQYTMDWKFGNYSRIKLKTLESKGSQEIIRLERLDKDSCNNYIDRKGWVGAQSNVYM